MVLIRLDHLTISQHHLIVVDIVTDEAITTAEVRNPAWALISSSALNMDEVRYFLKSNRQLRRQRAFLQMLLDRDSGARNRHHATLNLQKLGPHSYQNLTLPYSSSED